jgi:hypothetical protein
LSLSLLLTATVARLLGLAGEHEVIFTACDPHVPVITRSKRFNHVALTSAQGGDSAVSGDTLRAGLHRATNVARAP